MQETQRNTGSIPGSGRRPGVGNGNPLQYSCLETFMDKIGHDWVTPYTITKLAKVRRQVRMAVGGDGGRGIFLHGQLLLLSHFSRVRLCDPRDGSPPGSPIPGILQARTLEWVAVSFSNAWKWKVKVKSLSRVLLLATPWTAAHQAPPSMGFSRQEYWSGLPLPSPHGQLVEGKMSQYWREADSA